MNNWWVPLLEAVGLLVAMGGLFWKISAYNARKTEEHIDLRFQGEAAARKAQGDVIRTALEGLVQQDKEFAARLAQTERGLSDLRALLPEKYLRRDDYIRGQTLIESKLDGLAVRIENLQLRENARD